MINGMVTIDPDTLTHLSRYGIFQPSRAKSILGTITLRPWQDQSVEEKLKLLEYADLITGTKLPRFSKARRQAATRVLATANSRSRNQIKGRKGRSTLTSKPILTTERHLLQTYGIVSEGVDPLLALRYGIVQKALPSGKRQTKAGAA